VLAVLGATGYTGGLVLERAREAGLPLRLVGRRRDALEAAAREGEEVRVADARDAPALREAFAGCFAVASLAGPFLDVGSAPVAAALHAGAHYLDTSGEQEFALHVRERYDEEAKRRGVTVLTSFGFDYVPGDLAARLAAEELAEPLDEVVVAYAVAGTAVSRGTRRTIARVMTQRQVAWEEGRLVASRFGATTRRFAFPSGERDAVEWSGTEPLTVPRHTEVQRVRSYVRAPRAAAAAGRFGGLAAPLMRASARVGGNPSPERRAKNRFTVVAEATRGAEVRRATLAGTDVYGLTALLIVRGVEALRAGEGRAAGVAAPAEAFDVHALVPRLAPLLRRV
jgi:short subunit dehydrogenase-like uncharacterized protein